MLKSFFIFLLTLLTINALAQDGGSVVDEMLTDAAESDDEDLAETAEMTCEYIESITESKININTMNVNELQTIPVFNAIQIADIEEYRKKYGNIVSLGELKAITSITPKNLKLITNFITIADSSISNRRPTLREMFSKGLHYISSYNKMTIERQSAYIPDSTGSAKYNGGRMKWCMKYRYNFDNKIAWGIACEKDAGESIGFGNYKYGFDYYSIYLKIRQLGIIDNLILGDYTARFGQGLMLGGGFTTGKSMTGISYNNCSQIREYGSLNENRYYRGAAATIKAGRVSLTGFASLNLVDASCEGSEFHSFKTDGYHRTTRELAYKDNLREGIGGIMAEYSKNGFQIGAAAMYYCYDKKFVPRQQLRYAKMRSEKEGVGTSICYRYDNRKASFYGEFAMDSRQNISTINAADLNPANNIHLRILHRHYSENYQAFKALSFGQTSRASNEDGIYAGLAAEPCKWFDMEAWADVFRLPWAGAYNKLPASGNEAMLKSTFRINRRYNLTIRLKHKERKNSDLDNGASKTGYAKVSSVFRLSETTTLTTTAQWSRCCNGNTHPEHGYLICQDVKWSANTIPLTISARYALFSAPYSARIYSFESDVSGAFAAPGYYYDGQRVYLTAGCKIGGNVILQLKISQWHYFDRQKVGSGDSEIDGNRKSEISMFFKYSF